MSIQDPCLRRQGAALAGALALSLVMAESAAAQRMVRTDSLRRIQEVSPRSGPPGTVVTIGSENLPLQARVVVGAGALHEGFVELADAFQGEWGEISATVVIPEHASWERPLYFIAFNAVFSPIGLSDPFHVTNDSGMVRRKGRITAEGMTCVAMRDDDDNLYMLTGEIRDLQPGDEVVVEGLYTETSPCDQGDAIRVVSLVPGGS